MQVFSELIDCKIRKNDTVKLFANCLLKICNDIKLIDKNFSEWYLNYQFLRYLSSHFDSTVQALLKWKDDEFTFDKVMNEMVAEEVGINLRELDNRINASNIQSTTASTSITKAKLKLKEFEVM